MVTRHLCHVKQLFHHASLFILCVILYDDFQVDAESSKELEQWNEMLKNDAIKLCQENNFNTGFFEGSDNNTVSDACELKVSQFEIVCRIHILEPFHLLDLHRKHLLH